MPSSASERRSCCGHIHYKLTEDAVFFLIDVLDQQPSGPAFLNVKKAIVAFSGFSLNLGLTLKF
jgi:hypothetical protein